MHRDRDPKVRTGTTCRASPDARSSRQSNPVVLPLPSAPASSVRVECAIAWLCAGPFLQPLLPVGIGFEPAWPVLVGAGAAAFLAVVAAMRPQAWQMWAQIGLGLGLIALGASGSPIVASQGLVCFALGVTIAILAALQLEQLGRERTCRDHLGWRAPSPIGGTGPRLVCAGGERCGPPRGTPRMPPRTSGPNAAA